MPAAKRCSLGTSAWVIVAGWVRSVSTLPTCSTRVQSFTLLSSARPVAATSTPPCSKYRTSSVETSASTNSGDNCSRVTGMRSSAYKVAKGVPLRSTITERCGSEASKGTSTDMSCHNCVPRTTPAPAAMVAGAAMSPTSAPMHTVPMTNAKNPLTRPRRTPCWRAARRPSGKRESSRIGCGAYLRRLRPNTGGAHLLADLTAALRRPTTTDCASGRATSMELPAARVRLMGNTCTSPAAGSEPSA